ncbi:MAG: sulfur transferase domain-containing protein [Pseudomonadales bacterium]
MNRSLFRTITVVLLTLVALTARAETAAGSYSPHLVQVDDRTVIAGLLDLDALHAAHPGSVLVVDLRTPPEGTAAEAEAAAALGIDYTNIPVAGASVDPLQVVQLRAALDDADADTLVVVHCASGNRAGMLWGALQVSEGAVLADVQASLSEVLNKEPTIQGLEAYARTLNADQ